MTEVRDRERDEIEQVIEDMRTMARVAGQASVEGPISPLTAADARFAEYCARWADELEAVLRRSRAVLSPGGAAEKDSIR